MISDLSKLFLRILILLAVILLLTEDGFGQKAYKIQRIQKVNQQVVISDLNEIRIKPKEGRRLRAVVRNYQDSILTLGLFNMNRPHRRAKRKLIMNINRATDFDAKDFDEYAYGYKVSQIKFSDTLMMHIDDVQAFILPNFHFKKRKQIHDGLGIASGSLILSGLAIGPILAAYTIDGPTIAVSMFSLMGVGLISALASMPLEYKVLKTQDWVLTMTSMNAGKKVPNE